MLLLYVIMTERWHWKKPVAIAVMALFLVIAFAAIRVAVAAEDPFVRYATFGIVVWLMGQMMINIGMVLAVLPVIGIPLPLISYGGSALLPYAMAMKPLPYRLSGVARIGGEHLNVDVPFTIDGQLTPEQVAVAGLRGASKLLGK